MQDNLSYRIHDAKFNNGPEYLSTSELTGLLELVSTRCRQKTKARLYYLLARPLSAWQDFGIYRRVTFNNGQVDYICGQSWPDEMRTLRQCIQK